ncbi:MAG: signal peptidase I [Patescibacteria group bacterium]|nr:signal peptidase I [bacterium]MDZ4240521.1 signal peptidase I [Patescibacteria group bacterium]
MRITIEKLLMEPSIPNDTEPAKTDGKRPSGIGESIKELVSFVVLSLLIIIPFRMFIAQPFVVSGASMDPTFKNGDYLIVDEISYRFGEPQRGEVLIFKYPKNPSQAFIKRIIGLPGETLEIQNGHVTVKNDAYPEGLELSEEYVKYVQSSYMTVTLADDEYFVMGDNRAGSLDSRTWGPLKRSFFIGKPFVRLLPVGEVSLLPGDASDSY